MEGMKVSTRPARMPGRVMGTVTVRKADSGEAPRSREASTIDQSMRSTLEYTGSTMKGIIA